ncbi:NAD-dependent epimerase/dehydratase family protein [Lapidilactobacillus salsurivasis]
MNKQIVLFGGNGYLGRELTRQWHQADPTAEFWILSRSGRNSVTLANCHNIAVDVTDLAAVLAAVPHQIDYVVDLVGRPEKDPQLSAQINDAPARTMRQLAEQRHAKAMGFIGGRLGSAAFLATKRRLITELKTSSVPLAVVVPTVVYGADRHDKLAKMIPLLRFCGLFVPKMKPVRIETVITVLRQGLQEAASENQA